MKEKKKEGESKLDIFTKAVEAFGEQVKQRRIEFSSKSNLKEKRLIKGAGWSTQLDGYSLENLADHDLFVTGAYNLYITLSRLISNISPDIKFLELKDSAVEIQIALIEALNAIIKSEVTDESTAQVAKACRQLIAQSNRVVDRILKDKEGHVSRIIPSLLRPIVKLVTGDPNVMKTIDDVTPLTVDVLETLFDIVERRYRIEELSKKIEAFKDGNLPAHNELRQDLIKMLPNKFQKAFPLDGFLDEAFFKKYQEEWGRYLAELNKIEIGKLTLLGDKLALLESFLGKRESFEKSSLAFLTKVKELRDQLAPPLQEPKVEEPIPVAEEQINVVTNPGLEETPSSEEKSFPISSEKLEKTETVPSPTEIPVDVLVPESEKFEEKTVESVSPPPEPVEKPIKELSWDVKELQDMIEESNKTLKEQENKIKEQEEKIKTLGNTFNVLSDELNSFEVELQGRLTQKEKLREESARLKKWLEQEGPTAQAQLQKQQAEVATQRESIVKLKEDIAGDRLALDWRTHKDELAWLGLKSEEGLKDYLDAQKRETAIFGEVRATASNWWRSAWGEKVKPPIDYKVANTELLKNLDNTDKGLIGAQEEFEKQVKLLDQQVIKNQDQLEALNIQLPILEKEMETLEQQIKEKKATKIQIENDKKRAEGEKEKLETDNKELLIWKERLDEQKKLVDAEEEKKKLKADQLEKTNPLEQKAEQFVKDKESLAPVPNEPVNTTTTEKFSGTEKAKTPKEHYNELKEKYEEAKRLNKNIIPALLARIQGWFVYQKAKLLQPNFPPSPAVFPPPPKASAENAEMPENQKDKKPGSSTSSIKEGF